MTINLILGDSTSTSIGTANSSYPVLLSEKKVWPKNSTIINCSLPGLTSADLCAIFFKDFFKKLNDISNVIIYIGNCDSASSELRKGKYTKIVEIKQILYRKFGVKAKKTSLKNKLLYFEWNKNIDVTLENPENPIDYIYNINRIAKVCVKSNTNLILVKPKANQKFPAGLGKGNFIFYHYLGINDKSSPILQINDKRFINAYKFFEEKNYENASKIYYEILADFDVDKYGYEYPHVLVNNYSISKANLNQFEEAIFLLKMLLKEKKVRTEIIHYNLAQIYLKQGDLDLYQLYIDKSYELDTSMYRIRKPYYEALDTFSQKYQNIKVIDLHKLCPDYYFLDHCHLLPEGHFLLSEEIRKKLKFYGKAGKHKASISNNLYNPEISKGNVLEFFEYFKTFPNINQNLITKNVTKLNSLLNSTGKNNLSTIQLKSFSTEFREAFKYFRKHPIFYNDKQIFKTPPSLPPDIGRFPEFFLIKIIIPYMMKYESITFQKNLFSSNFIGLMSSIELLKLLPEKCKNTRAETPFWLTENVKKDDLKLLLSNIVHHLHNIILQGNMINFRQKSTIFWYVREALRFGGHSRISMLYDLLSLQFISEAIMVAYLGNINLSFKFDNKISKLASITEQLINTHQSLCLKFLSDPDKFDHEAYDHKIKSMEQNLLNISSNE